MTTGIVPVMNKDSNLDQVTGGYIIYVIYSFLYYYNMSVCFSWYNYVYFSVISYKISLTDSILFLIIRHRTFLLCNFDKTGLSIHDLLCNIYNDIIIQLKVVAGEKNSSVGVLWPNVQQNAVISTRPNAYHVLVTPIINAKAVSKNQGEYVYSICRINLIFCQATHLNFPLAPTLIPNPRKSLQGKNLKLG